MQPRRTPPITTFRITFGSEGVEDINDFKPSMIRNPRVTFLIDSDLRDDLLKELTFTNAGVRDEGIYYGDLESYRKAKGIGTGEPTTPDEDEDGGQSGSPL